MQYILVLIENDVRQEFLDTIKTGIDRFTALF